MAIREDGTVVFEGTEQTEVNRIVEERLARERGKYTDYEDIKGIAEELKAFGYEGTPTEIRQAIKAQREAVAEQTRLDELQQQAEEEGITPTLAKKIKDLEDKLEKSNKVIEEITGERTAKQQAAENKKAIDEAWNKQLKEFQEAYADVDLDQLAENPKFKKFIRGKNLPLKELYEDFTDFIGETEVEAIVKMKAKEERSTGTGKGSSEGGNYGLTPSQQTLCKKNGMTYKEYSEILKNIQ